MTERTKELAQRAIYLGSFGLFLVLVLLAPTVSWLLRGYLDKLNQ